jgi:hypothetical protein
MNVSRLFHNQRAPRAGAAEFVKLMSGRFPARAAAR